MIDHFLKKEEIQEIKVKVNGFVLPGSILHYGEKRIELDKQFTISFTMNDTPFNFLIYQQGRHWYPLDIVHMPKDKSYWCPFCGKMIQTKMNFVECEFLSGQIDELLEIVKNLNEIRLKLLF